jgi:RNA polymerase sigma-70 factor (ECF subfamily)
LSDIEPVCSPAEILDRMRSGDVQVLENLTRCYGQRLIAVGRRHCAERAEDAVQDALLNAGRNLASFRGEGSLEGWLVRLVANACHRMRRGRKNDPGRHASFDELPPVDLSLEGAASQSPEVRALQGEWARALGAALLELPAKDRMILLLSDAEDWKGPEIAAELGMTPEAVRTRLSRVRRRMRARLADVWGADAAPTEVPA